MPDFATFTTNRGATYEFEMYPVGTKFVRASGVYVVAKTSGDVVHPLYVGEAQSLHDRLNVGEAGHHGLQRARKLGATHICVRAANVLERTRLETELRHSFNPPCNKQSVPKNPLQNGLLG